MAKRIALFNHKGGVSKTTTTFNLGWMLAQMGNRVILVDGDPTSQGWFSATVVRQNLKNSILMNRTETSDLAWLQPSSPDLNRSNP